MGSIGGTYMLLGNMQKAKHFLEQALTISKELNDAMSVANASSRLAIMYAETGDTKNALSLAQDAKHLFVQIGNKKKAESTQQFIDQLQGGSSPAQSNPIQSAFESFQRAKSSLEMENAVRNYPFMVSNEFIQLVERVIKEQVPPEHKSAFEQRLQTLRQLIKK